MSKRDAAGYDIGSEDLQSIRSAVTVLHGIFETVSREWLAGLRRKADL